jgi:hypothetical protein
MILIRVRPGSDRASDSADARGAALEIAFSNRSIGVSARPDHGV